MLTLWLRGLFSLDSSPHCANSSHRFQNNTFSFLKERKKKKKNTGGMLTKKIDGQIVFAPFMVLLKRYWSSPFPSSSLPLCQNESSCKTFDMKMSLICMKRDVQVKHIFIRIVSHLDSFWHRGKQELVNGLLNFAVAVGKAYWSNNWQTS